MNKELHQRNSLISREKWHILGICNTSWVSATHLGYLQHILGIYNTSWVSATHLGYLQHILDICSTSWVSVTHLSICNTSWVSIRGHPRAFREGEVLQQFQDFREKFWSKFWISLYILYIFTSPSAQDMEKSASLGRLFFLNCPLG